MASRLAAATPAQVSHIPLPGRAWAVPRSLPVKLPDHTKLEADVSSANSIPQKKVWVQEKWRSPASNAAKQAKLVQYRRLVKAEKHETLGMNIYAYTHMRSKQVIYSLTRVLDNQTVMDQLVFHGKKSVPAGYRKDVWLPYFSIKFPQTPAGALVGHQIYQQLRELSLQRQLEPPKELTIASEEDIAIIRNKKIPIDLDSLLAKIRASRTSKTRVYMPELGKTLPQKLRGRKIMNTKAWSVADVAFLMSLYNKGPSPLERMEEVERQRSLRFHKTSKTQKRKMIARALETQEEQAELAGRRHGMQQAPSSEQSSATKVVEVQNQDTSRAYAIDDLYYKLVKPGKAVRAELAYLREKRNIRELLGPIGDKIRNAAEQKLQQAAQNPSTEDVQRKLIEKEIVQEQEARYQALNDKYDSLPSRSKEVQILWRDERDAFSAQEWPENVFHGILETATPSLNLITDEAATQTAQTKVFNEDAEATRAAEVAEEVRSSVEPSMIRVSEFQVHTEGVQLPVAKKVSADIAECLGILKDAVAKHDEWLAAMEGISGVSREMARAAAEWEAKMYYVSSLEGVLAELSQKPRTVLLDGQPKQSLIDHLLGKDFKSSFQAGQSKFRRKILQDAIDQGETKLLELSRSLPGRKAHIVDSEILDLLRVQCVNYLILDEWNRDRGAHYSVVLKNVLHTLHKEEQNAMLRPVIDSGREMDKLVGRIEALTRSRDEVEDSASQAQKSSLSDQTKELFRLKEELEKLQKNFPALIEKKKKEYIYGEESPGGQRRSASSASAEGHTANDSLETDESEESYKQKREEWMKSQGYVVDQPTTLWSRAKSLFGR